jgi:dihydrolipoamide dehydrogenase
MDKILEGRSAGAMNKADRNPNLTVEEGSARFLSPTALLITRLSGQTIEVDFEKAIIATGAKSMVPPFEGDATDALLVTENFFRMKTLPKSLTIIGGGPIGIELAQMLTNLGVKVTIVEMLDELLKGVAERDFAQTLTGTLREMGIDLRLSTQVRSIHKDRYGFHLSLAREGSPAGSLFSEQVLVAVGKVPNVIDLGLENLGIDHSNKGIAISEYLETTVPGIYATGDVNTGPKFAHVASWEAQIVVQNILVGNKIKADFNKNAWVLFSQPELAIAGFTQEQAKAAGFDARVGTYQYQIDATAQIQEDLRGLLRFVVDNKTQRILGVHLLGNGASELIGEAALIVAKELTLADIAWTIHPHPTLTEAFGFLAREMTPRVVQEARS